MTAPKICSIISLRFVQLGFRSIRWIQVFSRARKSSILRFMKKFMYIFGALVALRFRHVGVLLFVLHVTECIPDRMVPGVYCHADTRGNIIRSKFNFWANGGPSKTLVSLPRRGHVGWVSRIRSRSGVRFCKVRFISGVTYLVIVAMYLLLVEFVKKYFYKKYEYLIRNSRQITIAPFSCANRN